MSQADIELIKAVIAAFNDGDFPRMLDLFDEDAEVQRVGGLATVHGKQAIRVGDGIERRSSWGATRGTAVAWATVSRRSRRTLGTR